jgi:hypothetical protein
LRPRIVRPHLCAAPPPDENAPINRTQAILLLMCVEA